MASENLVVHESQFKALNLSPDTTKPVQAFCAALMQLVEELDISKTKKTIFRTWLTQIAKEAK